MKNIKYLIQFLFITSLLFGFSSCELEELEDPNGASVELQENPTILDLKTLVAGTEHLLRDEVGFWYEAVGIIGRECYRFTSSDPRYTSDLLGKGEATLDNNTFYTTRTFTGRYRTVRNTNILITAVNNISATTGITEEEKNGFLGFAKTIQAYELLIVSQHQGDCGIRFDVANVDNLGPFLGSEQALQSISGLLDEAVGHLDNAGSEFIFGLAEGFVGFDSPATFKQFNRAIAARVAAYQGDFSKVLNLLGSTFLDETGGQEVGPALFYGSAGTDLTNPLTYVPNDANALLAHPSYVTDLEEGDTRSSKVAERESVYELDDLSSGWDVALYFSQTAGIPIIKNAELILLKAEASTQTGDVGGATAAINAIRTANGLGEYGGGTSTDELINEILKQRRYSLFMEGHRWIDMRRYNKLNELPIDRAGDDVFNSFPRPLTENEPCG